MLKWLCAFGLNRLNIQSSGWVGVRQTTVAAFALPTQMSWIRNWLLEKHVKSFAYGENRLKQILFYNGPENFRWFFAAFRSFSWKCNGSKLDLHLQVDSWCWKKCLSYRMRSQHCWKLSSLDIIFSCYSSLIFKFLYDLVAQVQSLEIH